MEYLLKDESSSCGVYVTLFMSILTIDVNIEEMDNLVHKFKSQCKNANIKRFTEWLKEQNIKFTKRNANSTSSKSLGSGINHYYIDERPTKTYEFYL